jgi:hypothetical protein
MGTDINGYVEVNTVQVSDEDCWFAVIDIDILVERNYDLFGKLFGVRAQSGFQPLAATKGIPVDTSNTSIFDGHGNSVVCHTWVDWGELSAFMPNLNVDSALYGWLFIFNSMESLAKKYGNDNVRLVVAFDNFG